MKIFCFRCSQDTHIQTAKRFWETVEVKGESVWVCPECMRSPKKKKTERAVMPKTEERLEPKSPKHKTGDKVVEVTAKAEEETDK